MKSEIWPDTIIKEWFLVEFLRGVRRYLDAQVHS